MTRSEMIGKLQEAQVRVAPAEPSQEDLIVARHNLYVVVMTLKAEDVALLEMIVNIQHLVQEVEKLDKKVLSMLYILQHWQKTGEVKA